MTEPTRVLIAEDEPLAAEALADWVARMPALQLVATCGDGASALAQIRALQPDLVLMDIQMPVLTGLQVLQALADDERPPAVIFTTAYDEHALTAFELHAVDYLLKPFTHERFVEAIAHVRRDARAAVAGAVDALQAPDGAPLARVLVRVESLTPDENSQLVARMTDGTLITANRDVSRKLREQSI